MKRCTIKTLKLNCGCCEDTILECDYEDGHDGMHHIFIVELKHTYEIYWTDVSGVSRETEPPKQKLTPGVTEGFHW